MLHWNSKVTIILRKRKMGKKTIIVRQMEYYIISLSNMCNITHVKVIKVAIFY